MTGATELHVNGKTHVVTSDPATPLLYVLRDELHLTGPKFGCGLAQCGACAVLSDGREIRSCVTLLSAATGHRITTVEGLGTAEHPHPLQEAFIAEQAVQCGYCTSGMIIAAASLLAANPHPTADEVALGMNGHLCRCATYTRITRAIVRVAARSPAE
jgi:nicotinate dehydrogenase subunit A